MAMPTRPIRTLLVLIGLLLVALIALALQRHQPAPNLPEPTAIALPSAGAGTTPLFEDVSREDVVLLALEEPASGAQLALEYSPDADIWVQDTGLILAPTLGDALAETVAILPYQDRIPVASPADYAQYGITQSEVSLIITLILRDESLHRVAVGRLTPDGTYYYAAVDNQQPVYRIPRQPIAFLLSNLRRLKLGE